MIGFDYHLKNATHPENHKNRKLNSQTMDIAKSLFYSLLDSSTKEKVCDCTPLWGFIENAENDNKILLCKDAVNSYNKMEISKNDIIYATSTPKEILSGQGMIVWVRNHASITFKKTLKRSNP